MKRALQLLVIALLVWSQSGCGEETDFVIRPTSTDSLSLTSTSYDHTLSETPHAVASSNALGTMLATSSGLYQLNASGITALRETAIVGLAAYGDAFIYASQDTVSIWDGTTTDSGLNDFFEDATFTGLAVFEEDIWIATQESVYLHRPGGMLEFPGLSEVTHFSSFVGSNQVILSAADGSSYLLESQNETFFGQSLASEPISRALVGMQDSIYAHDQGTLLQRLPASVEDTVSWHPVALTTQADDPGETGVLEMLSDPQTGATWLRTETAIKRLQQDRVYSQELPSPNASLIGIADDASLWLADETTIYKLEGNATPVTFAGDIQSFNETNCSDCHAPGGPAREIDTYEQWVAQIEEIIAVIEDGTMPAGGRELEGATVQLLYQWLEDGLRP